MVFISKKLIIGEGSKPIFEREEIKNIFTQTNEITKHRTVLVVNIKRSGMFFIKNINFLSL